MNPNSKPALQCQPTGKKHPSPQPMDVPSQKPPQKPLCILSPIDVHTCLCSHPCCQITLCMQKYRLEPSPCVYGHFRNGCSCRGGSHDVCHPLLFVPPTLGSSLCRNFLSAILFLIPLCSSIKLKLKLHESLHLVCAKRDQMLFLFVFLPSLFVVVKRGEQKGLCVLAGLSSA